MPRYRIASVLLVGLVAVAATACGGDKAAPDGADAPDTAAAAPPAEPPAPAATVASAGETQYQRCVTCHQANGAGMPTAFPPLAGSEYVNGSADRMVAIIMHGLQGPISVNGAQFNSAMLPYGTSVPMSDDEVAAVATYVRSSWGNTGGAVSAADVARVREATKSRTTPWTVAELASFK
jgi:mono/diheme cytochrome c family protein